MKRPPIGEVGFVISLKMTGAEHNKKKVARMVALALKDAMYDVMEHPTFTGKGTVDVEWEVRSSHKL